MVKAAHILISTTGVLAAGFFLVFAMDTWREKARRAFRLSFICVLAAIGFALLPLWLPDMLAIGVAGLTVAFLILVVIFLVITKPPTVGSNAAKPSSPGFAIPQGDHTVIPPTGRIDERDIPFARIRLRPGSQAYQTYYQDKPERKQTDDRWRALPGLLSPTSSTADPVLFPMATASFLIPEALRKEVDGPAKPEQIDVSPERATRVLKGAASHYGATSVGVTVLDPDHIYSHVGRGEGTFGESIVLDHTCALAFSVEMDHQMTATAPEAPEVVETAYKYASCATIAVQLAATIREWGYEARAHIDGNYRVIAPLVAQAAGLGSIGRMGLLMTPKEGPRVRLGVVTTTLPLVADVRLDERYVIDFCTHCKKCAENCPSHAISFDDPETEEGEARWRIDPDRCFTYWNVIGTDCGRCLHVCPYSHPNTLSHNIVRWIIRQPGAASHLAIKMDDFFYGKRPAKGNHPGWFL